MALSPVISACLENNCTELKVSDITGVYNDTTNTGGWGTPNFEGSDVTEAFLYITYPNTTTTQTIDVTAQIPDTITGDLDFTNISPDDSYTKFPDGKYEIKYSVSDGADTYTYCLSVVFYCQINCAANQLFVQVPNNLDDEAFMDNVTLVRNLLAGLEASACCIDTDSLNTIIEKLKGLTDYEDCNCD